MTRSQLSTITRSTSALADCAGSSSRNSLYPRTTVSGVRNSWLTLRRYSRRIRSSPSRRSFASTMRPRCARVSSSRRALSMAIAAWSANADIRCWSSALNARRSLVMTSRLPSTSPPRRSGTPRNER